MSCLRGGMAKIVSTGPKPHGLLDHEFPKGLAVAAPRPAIADQEQVLSIRLAGARPLLASTSKIEPSVTASNAASSRHRDRSLAAHASLWCRDEQPDVPSPRPPPRPPSLKWVRLSIVSPPGHAPRCWPFGGIMRVVVTGFEPLSPAYADDRSNGSRDEDWNCKHLRRAGRVQADRDPLGA